LQRILFRRAYKVWASINNLEQESEDVGCQACNFRQRETMFFPHGLLHLSIRAIFKKASCNGNKSSKWSPKKFEETKYLRPLRHWDRVFESH
jgi:hypothetical protein